MIACLCFLFLMIRRPPRSTRTDTLVPYTTLFRSLRLYEVLNAHHLDAFNGLSGYDTRLIPLHRYLVQALDLMYAHLTDNAPLPPSQRSEEHTSELQSLMRISYAVLCLKKNTTPLHQIQIYYINKMSRHKRTQ